MATKANDENQKNEDPQLDSSISSLGNPPPIQKHPNINCRKEKTIKELKIISVIKKEAL